MTDKTIKLYGRSAARGVAEGEALVANEPLSFLFDIDITKGTIVTPSSKMKGKSVAGKVLVFPIARGSSGGPLGLYMLAKANKLPLAVVNIEADLTAVAGTMLANIPMVFGLDQNPLEVIKTGDFVRVDGDRGIVEVIKK